MNSTNPLFKHSAEHYRQKALRCRRLARDIPDPADPTARKLVDLAVLYDGLARAKQETAA